MRSALGNPRKNDSIGDSINWTLLLQSVPDSADLHVISEDGDFYSALKDQAHLFLTEEWERVKVHDYSSIERSPTSFEHFDGVAFAFDKDKESLIEDLFDSWSLRPRTALSQSSKTTDISRPKRFSEFLMLWMKITNSVESLGTTIASTFKTALPCRT